MRRVSLLGLPWVIVLIAGCSPRPTGPMPSDSTTTRTTTSAAQDELARRDAELASARAEVADLRRRLDERSRPPAAEPAPEPEPVTGPDGLTLVARRRLHDGPVTSLAFAPDGAAVASTDTLGRVLVSSAADLAPVLTLQAATGSGVQNCTHSVCFSADGRYLAAGSEDRTVWIWRATDGELVKRVRGHRDSVEYVTFVSDSTGGLSFDREGVGLAWSVQGQRRELIPDRRLRRAVVTPDGDLLVWTDGLQTFCGPPGREAPDSTLGGFADILAVSRDGEVVAKGSNTNCVEVWDTRSGARRWAGPPQPGRVQALTFRQDGRMLVSLAGGSMSVWDARTGDEKHRFRGRSDEGATRLALAADGRTVAVGNRRGSLAIVRLPE
jgi:WD40 repeat protein